MIAPISGQPLPERKRTQLLGALGVQLLLAGSFLSADWMTFAYGLRASLYAGVAKPTLTLVSLLLVLAIGRNHVDEKDRRLLLFAFLCMFPTDILMSIVSLTPNMPVDSPVFMAGGLLSIVAHVFLIVRFGRGFPYLRRTGAANAGRSWAFRLWLPLAIYGSAVVLVLVLWNDMARVGHLVIGPIYTAFFCTTTWFAWETVRYGLLPRRNAWFGAIAATCWYLTEITGEIYNIGIGSASEIAYRIVWVFYGTNVILMGLSGFNWDRPRA